MANQINIAVGADIKDLQDGLKLAVNQMEKAGKDMTQVGESVSRLTSNNFKSLSQAYRTTSKDAEVLALHLGTESDAFKQAALMAQTYGQQLSDVRAKIAGVDMDQGGSGVQKVTTQFNGLSNSINQLTREMPAFTYSVQTGFMALSNNIPMFVDQIQNIKKANLELAASGQPVQSVFKQVAGAFLSFNTLMSVGITALTMFSPALIDFAEKLFGAGHAQEELNKKQKEFNDLAYEYLATEKQKAIDKEAESYNKLTSALKENIRLTALSVEASQVEGKSRFDLIMNKTKELQKLEEIETQHKKNLAKINEDADSKNRARIIKESSFEVSMYEDKFSKMKDALAKFKDEDSFQAMKDLALPVFDPNTINEAGIDEGVEAAIQPFVHLRNGIGEQLDATMKKVEKWKDAIAGVMAQAGASFGQALVTGDFDEAGKAIVRQLGGIAVQIGAAIIAIGIPQAAIGLPSGFAYIAGGTALSILGGAMQATGVSSGGSGSGGNYSGSMGGGYSPMMGGAQNNFSFDGVVRGSNLEIVLLNTNQQNRRIR